MTGGSISTQHFKKGGTGGDRCEETFSRKEKIMIKGLINILFVVGIIVMSELGALAQDCATVDMQESAASNTNVTALISVVNCRQDVGQSIVAASVAAQSNNPAARVQTQLVPMQDGAGTAGVQILAQPVNSCTPPANITFTMRFKLKRGSENPGPEQIKTVTKTLIVCPFQFDVQVSSLNLVQAAAGQDSTVNVTLRNQGAQTLYRTQLNLTLSTVESMNGLVRNSCSSSIGNSVDATNVQFPLEIRAGQEGIASARFRFAQAGGLTMRAQVSMGGEDGPSTNNVLTQAVTVPLPRPLVCEIQPVAGQVDTFTIKGNWFRRLGTTEVPTVTFANGIAATGVQVISPLELRGQFSGYSCLAGPLNVTVTNAAGGTTAPGPVLPGPLSITGTTTTELAGAAFDLRVQLANFRPNCNVTVTMVPVQILGRSLAVGGAFNPSFTTGPDQITVRLFHTTSTPTGVGPVSQYTLQVITPYGTATKEISVGPEPSKLPKTITPIRP